MAGRRQRTPARGQGAGAEAGLSISGLPRKEICHGVFMITELDGLIAEATAETHEPVRQALASVQPIFILALPRSHSAVVCAMLGQHPQMYGFPETNLFCAPTMEKWREMCDTSRFHMADGLLRAAGQLLYGEQTEASVKAAEGWLSRRSHFTTSLIFETLAEMTGGLV